MDYRLQTFLLKLCNFDDRTIITICKISFGCRRELVDTDELRFVANNIDNIDSIQ